MLLLLLHDLSPLLPCQLELGRVQEIGVGQRALPRLRLLFLGDGSCSSAATSLCPAASTLLLGSASVCTGHSDQNAVSVSQSAEWRCNLTFHCTHSLGLWQAWTASAVLICVLPPCPASLLSLLHPPTFGWLVALISWVCFLLNCSCPICCIFKGRDQEVFSLHYDTCITLPLFLFD